MQIFSAEDALPVHPMLPTLSILHAEPRAFWRDHVAAVAEQWPEVRIIGTVSTAADAIACCLKLRPSVLLLDFVLADDDGFSLAERVARIAAPPAVIFLTERDDEVVLHRTERSAAHALIWKTARFAHHLRPALRAAGEGRRYFPPEVRERLRRVRGSPLAYYKILSEHEQQLLARFCAGDSDTAIARDAGCCESTVRVHFHRMQRKLAVRNRTELLHWAIRTGFSAHPFSSSADRL